MHRFILSVSVVFTMLFAAFTFAQTTEAPLRLGLEEAVRMALETNPDITLAASLLSESEYRVSSVRADLWPKVQGKAAYDVWTEDQRLFAATRNGEPGVFGNAVAGAEITASIPIYTGGRRSAEIRSAEWNSEALLDQMHYVKESIVYDVTSIYYSLLAQRYIISSLETAVLAMEEQKRVIQALVDADKAARVDLLRTDVRKAELNERLVRSRNDRVLLQRAWSALLGLHSSVLPDAEGEISVTAFDRCPEPAVCFKRALDHRPDYQALQATMMAAEAQVRVARSGYFPTLTGQASYGLRWIPDPSSNPGNLDQYSDTGRVGLVLSIPIFDGWQTGSRVGEQKARLQAAEARVRKVELQIQYQVQAALADISSAHERISLTRQAIDQAEESYRIVKEKYDLGRGTMIDILDAQSALVNAQTKHAESLADLAISHIRLRLVTGDIMS